MAFWSRRRSIKAIVSIESHARLAEGEGTAA